MGVIVNILQMWGLKQRGTEDLTDHVVAPESGTWPLALTAGSGNFFLESIFMIYLFTIYVVAQGLSCGARNLQT